MAGAIAAPAGGRVWFAGESAFVQAMSADGTPQDGAQAIAVRPLRRDPDQAVALGVEDDEVDAVQRFVPAALRALEVRVELNGMILSAYQDEAGTALDLLGVAAAVCSDDDQAVLVPERLGARIHDFSGKRIISA